RRSRSRRSISSTSLAGAVAPGAGGDFLDVGFFLAMFRGTREKGENAGRQAPTSPRRINLPLNSKHASWPGCQTGGLPLPASPHLASHPRQNGSWDGISGGPAEEEECLQCLTSTH